MGVNKHLTQRDLMVCSQLLQTLTHISKPCSCIWKTESFIRNASQLFSHTWYRFSSHLKWINIILILLRVVDLLLIYTRATKRKIRPWESVIQITSTTNYYYCLILSSSCPWVLSWVFTQCSILAEGKATNTFQGTVDWLSWQQLKEAQDSLLFLCSTEVRDEPKVGTNSTSTYQCQLLSLQGLCPAQAMWNSLFNMSFFTHSAGGSLHQPAKKNYIMWQFSERQSVLFLLLTTWHPSDEAS